MHIKLTVRHFLFFFMYSLGIENSSLLAFSPAPVKKYSEEVITRASDSIDLTTYISKYIDDISIPKDVRKLVDKYRHCSSKQVCIARRIARDKAFKEKQVGGGRKRGWVKENYGMTENANNKDADDFFKVLKDVPAPMTWSLEDIDNAYEQAIKKLAPSHDKPKIYMEKGLSANYLSRLGEEDFIVQLASQFNYLEATSRKDIATIDSYIDDYTQGPQASLEAASAALHRRVAVMSGKLKDALINVLPPGSNDYYQNGYLELFRIQKESELKKVLDTIKHNIKKLKILPQWVINEAENTKQLQVFSAAPSYQGQKQPRVGSVEADLCDLIVSSQYEAIAKLAVIRQAQQPKEKFFVHLTLVGQGAFNNPPSVMESAFKKVADVVKGYPNIYVVIHGYSENDQKKIKDALDAQKIDFEVTTTRIIRKGLY